MCVRQGLTGTHTLAVEWSLHISTAAHSLSIITVFPLMYNVAYLSSALRI